MRPARFLKENSLLPSVIVSNAQDRPQNRGLSCPFAELKGKSKVKSKAKSKEKSKEITRCPL